jgi:hypothetical protein
MQLPLRLRPLPSPLPLLPPPPPLPPLLELPGRAKRRSGQRICGTHMADRVVVFGILSAKLSGARWRQQGAGAGRHM